MHLPEDLNRNEEAKWHVAPHYLLGGAFLISVPDA